MYFRVFLRSQCDRNNNNQTAFQLGTSPADPRPLPALLPTMSETTYHLENAASGRAKCKKCKETIAKGELRISTREWPVASRPSFGRCRHCSGSRRRAAPRRAALSPRRPLAALTLALSPAGDGTSARRRVQGGPGFHLHHVSFCF